MEETERERRVGQNCRVKTDASTGHYDLESVHLKEYQIVLMEI